MKAVVIYSTRHGCTAMAAELLRAALRDGADLVRLPGAEWPELSPYDTVILGTPIYVGKGEKALLRFSKAKLDELRTKRLGLFICAGDEDEGRSAAQLGTAFPAELMSLAVAKGNLGGDLDYGKLGGFTKFILRRAKGITSGYSRLSPARVEAFAARLADGTMTR